MEGVIIELLKKQTNKQTQNTHNILLKLHVEAEIIENNWIKIGILPSHPIIN